MRIYENAYELMSEMGRNLWEMGLENKPNFYQNKDILGDDNFLTKELVCEQYCLLSMEDDSPLFYFTDETCKAWVKAELEERLRVGQYDEVDVEDGALNPGDAWRIRKEVWDEFLVDGMFDYTYPERLYYKGLPIVGSVINLLQDDPGTRKAIIPIYSLEDNFYINGERRIPCSMYYQLLLRTKPNGDKFLTMIYNQRSSDFITHFGNDVWLAWKMGEYIADAVGVKMERLIHNIGSLHVYKKDWDKLKNGISK